MLKLWTLFQFDEFANLVPSQGYWGLPDTVSPALASRVESKLSKRHTTTFESRNPRHHDFLQCPLTS